VLVLKKFPTLVERKSDYFHVKKTPPPRPLVPLFSHIKLFYVNPSQFFKITFIIIVSFPPVLDYLHPRKCRVFVHLFLLDLITLIMFVEQYVYEASHFVVFFSPMLSHFQYTQIAAPCFQNTVFPLLEKPNFTLISNNRPIVFLLILFFVFR
jgi:hypothetical protein